MNLDKFPIFFMDLFKPYRFKNSGITVHNRIALAPMTNLQSTDDGTLGEDEYRWLTRRAKEGFGMIITCAAHVSADGQGWHGELAVSDDMHISGLTRLSAGIHQYGSIAVMQIFHGGARSHQDVTGSQPWSASAHIYTVGSKDIDVREGTDEDITAVIDSFVNAAVRAERAGFDGVELHGAHGYLLHQFISTVTNKRTDDWGGSFDNRTRLIRTILKGIKSSVSSKFIVGVRLSPEDKYTFQGIDFDESLHLAKILSDEGADYIHISPWEALKKPEKYLHEDKALITRFREVLPVETPLIVAGDIWTVADADTAMHLGADIIALGRAAIGIPDWPTKAQGANFVPQMPPYTPQHLRAAGLGENFISYMRRWKGFVDES
jgi:2,4-dienoyl-CoA reductase-like NADH-dependent reductase (Old Yellow Enzyme family)